MKVALKGQLTLQPQHATRANLTRPKVDKNMNHLNAHNTFVTIAMKKKNQLH